MNEKPLLASAGALVLALSLSFLAAARAAADSPPETGPAARGYSVLAYDEDEDLVVMMGGIEYSGDWKGLNDLWVFYPETDRWELVGDLQDLIFDSIAYDAGAGKLIAYCAFRYNPDSTSPWGPIDQISETWAYDVSTNTWENLNPGSIKPPKGLLGSRMAYDAESGVMILHGGMDFESARPSNATWAYDSASNKWTNMRPQGAPPGTNFHGLTYHAAADRVIRVGGWNIAGAYYTVTNDVFAYDYNENVWTQLDSGDAPVRGYVSANYIPFTGRIILFGGATYDDSDLYLMNAIPNGDTWEFDYFSNTWTLLQPKKSPSPRIWHGMTATQTGIVLFGGGETRDTPTDETWLFDPEGEEWKEVKRRQ